MTRQVIGHYTCEFVPPLFGVQSSERALVIGVGK
jgi:hypothetical protein